MERNLRSDVKRRVLLLLGVDRKDRDDVSQGIGVVTPDALAAAIRAKGRAEAGAFDRSEITVPEVLSRSDEQQGYRAQVIETAEGQLYSGLPPTSIDAARPDLMHSKTTAAGSAAAELDAVDAKLGCAQAEASAEEKRFAQEEERHGRRRTFAGRLRNLAVVGVALFVLDAGVVFLGQANFAGAFQYASLAEVPGQVWAQAALSAIPTLIAGIVLGIVGVKLLSRFGLPRALTILVGVFVVLMLAAVVGGQGIMRWLGALPAEELTPERLSLGAFGTLLTTAISSLVVAGSVVWAHARIEQVLGLYRAAVDREASHTDRMALIGKEVAIHSGRRATLTEAIGIPDELRARFEAAVAAWVSKLREHEAAIEDRVRRAVAAFEHLLTLSPVELEAVIDEVYRIQRDGEDTPPIGSTAFRNGAAKAGTFLSALVFAAHLSLVGCGGTPPRPFSVVVGCDATGEDAEAVCSHFVLQREVERWFALARTRPGSTFRVVLSAESHAATRVTDPILGATGGLLEQAPELVHDEENPPAANAVPVREGFAEPLPAPGTTDDLERWETRRVGGTPVALPAGIDLLTDEMELGLGVLLFVEPRRERVDEELDGVVDRRRLPRLAGHPEQYGVEDGDGPRRAAFQAHRSANERRECREEGRPAELVRGFTRGTHEGPVVGEQAAEGQLRETRRRHGRCSSLSARRAMSRTLAGQGDR